MYFNQFDSSKFESSKFYSIKFDSSKFDLSNADDRVAYQEMLQSAPAKLGYASVAPDTTAFPSHAAAGFVLIAEDGMGQTLIEHTQNAQLRLAQVTQAGMVIQRWRCVYSDSAARIVDALHQQFAEQRLTHELNYFLVNYSAVYLALLDFDPDCASIKRSSDLVIGTLCRMGDHEGAMPGLFEVSGFCLKGAMRMARIKPCVPDKQHAVVSICYEVPVDFLIRVPA